MSKTINRPIAYTYRRLLDVCNYINAKYYPNKNKNFFGFITDKHYIPSDGFIAIHCSDYANEEEWVKDFVQLLKEEFTDGFTDSFTVLI